MSRCCGNCRFPSAPWKEGDNGTFVFCRRFPPQVFAIGETVRTQFPVASVNIVCGEHRYVKWFTPIKEALSKPKPKP